MKNTTLRFGSVCSGIEAASVAWEPLGWKAAWLSEIEPFPSAVLAHHYPDVPNLGDMTALPDRILSGEVEAPDIFCGGTPCQAFSVAGKRQSLDDARGNLSLIFCEIANAIDHVRSDAGDDPAVIFWENVPGVLSTKDNAFGCFLGELSGESCALVPPGGKWSNAGCVLGPKRAIAWRVMDAQYFGVAQRRRRVFVVASARDGFDPAEILFESDGLRRDIAPSREPGQGFAADVAPSLVSSGRGTERIGETRGQDPVVAVPAEGCWRDGGQVSQTLDAVLAKGQTMPEKNRFPAVLQPTFAIQAGATRTNPASGPDGVGVQADHAYTLEARAEVQCVAFSCKDYGADAGPVSPTLRAMGHAGSHPNAGGQVAIASYAFQPRIARNGRGDMGDLVHALNAQSGETGKGDSAPCVAVLNRLQVSPTLQAGGNETGGIRPPGTTVDTADSLIPMAFVQNTRDEVRLMGGDGNIVGALAAETGAKQQCYVMQPDMLVRRITPRECERLQGFPDDYTLIPYGRVIRLEKLEADWIKYLLRGGVMTFEQVCQAAADGPRYKALGNSWAVPNIRWIGRRIDAAIRKNADLTA